MIAASSIETEGNKEPLPKCFQSCLYNISLVFHCHEFKMGQTRENGKK